jgi:drug/metabolite transporter (DMT)-like permease
MSFPESSARRGTLFVLIAVLFWGGSASLAKFLFTTRFDTLIVVQSRSSLSFLLLFLYFLLRDRSVFKIERKDLRALIPAGVIGIAVTNFSYYYTVGEATVATAILVQYTAPVLVMVYAVLVSKEETFNGIKVIALVLSLLGCYLAVSGGDWTAIQLKGWTVVSGITSSLSFAFMLLISKYLLRKYSVWTMLVYAFGFSTVFWLFINTPWQIADKGYSVTDWGILLMFALVSILIPHSLFASGLKLLDASTVGIVTTMEPVVAIVVAYFALGETLGQTQVIGGMAVVTAVVLLQWAETRKWVRARGGRNAR